MMKYIKCYIVLFVFFAFVSCDKMDDPFKEFIVKGGANYPGKITPGIAHPGKNRVKLSWIPSADPTVEKIQVFWNNFQDSLEVKLSDMKTRDTVSVIIDDLPEKSSYAFTFKTYNAEGSASVPVEMLTRVYGEDYQNTIHNRPVIKSEIWGSPKEVSILWDQANITKGAVAEQLKYTDTSGNSRIETYPVTSDTTIIKDMKGGTALEYRTAYLPEESIDTFYTDFEKNDSYYLNKKDWKVIDFSLTHKGKKNEAANFIDGNPKTRWHTQLHKSKYPHFVTVDMGAEYRVSNFEIYSWTNDAKNRAPDTFKLLSSTDNDTWTDLGEFDFDRMSYKGQVFSIDSPPKARYFKFVGLTGHYNYMVMGEISIKYFNTIPE